MKTKKYIYLIFAIIFIILTLVGGMYTIGQKLNPAYQAIPALCAIFFIVMYHNCKKAIEDNEKNK